MIKDIKVSSVTGPTMKTREAARYLSISKWTLYKLVKEGKLTPIFGDGVRSPWRFKVRELDRYLDSISLPKRGK